MGPEIICRSKFYRLGSIASGSRDEMEVSHCGTTIIATRHPPPRLTPILATAANTSYKMGCTCTALKSPKHAFWKPIIYQLSLPKSVLEGFAAETGKGVGLHQSISRTDVSYHPEYMQFLEAISHCQEDIPVLQRS